MVNFCTTSLAVLGAIVPFVRAQTAPGFPVSTTGRLNITFGSNEVSPAGELLPRPDVANAPTISTTALSDDDTGVLFMVDSDVPRNGTRVQLLHWLVANVTRSSNGSLSIPSTAIASYRQPSPPVGDSPHAYTFLLFEQPDDFTIPDQFSTLEQTRLPFNLTEFLAAVGLENDDLLAANYINVQNLTGVTATATTFPPARATNFTNAGTGAGSTFGGGATATSSATDAAATTGAAVKVDGEVWAGVGAAVMAGVAALVL